MKTGNLFINHDSLSGDNILDNSGQRALSDLVLHQDSRDLNMYFSEIPEEEQESRELLVDNISVFLNSFLVKDEFRTKYKNDVKSLINHIAWKEISISKKNIFYRIQTLEKFNYVMKMGNLPKFANEKCNFDMCSRSAPQPLSIYLTILLKLCILAL